MKSTIEIKEILQAATVQELPEFIAAYSGAPRTGEDAGPDGGKAPGGLGERKTAH